jgi:hypothetical protein
MQRPLLRTFLAALLGGLVLLAGGRGDASEPCRVATGDSPVAKACAEGGVPRAREFMRQLVKQARNAGTRFQCDNCHGDEDRYDRLSPEAKQNFAKLLAAAGQR